MLVISVQGSFDRAKQTIEQAQKYGDLIELRLDLLEKNNLAHIAELKALSTLPLIFTLRRKNQGGAFRGSEKERENKLFELLTLKPKYVDLEYDCAFAGKIDPSISIIASYHDFEKTPDHLEEILPELKRFPSAIKKIATMAHSSIDALRMLNFSKKYGIAGMCMGKEGKMTRILGPIFNIPLTYACIGEKGISGQVCAAELCRLYHFRKLNKETKIYALIGDPVDKSIGHFCHNYAFEKQKENAVYVKFRVTASELPSFFKEVATLPFFGFSVTMPLKQHTAIYLDSIDPQAQVMGVVNTMTKKGGKWHGSNTDGAGALDALERKGKICGKICLIIGAGGVAKSIAHAAKDRGGKIIIANRTSKKGKDLASKIGGTFVSFHAIPDYDIVINATSVGMSSSTQHLPIADKDIKENAIVFDVITNPIETAFLTAARNKGATLVYGYEMFFQQAAWQLKTWFDHPVDEESLLRFIEKLSSRSEMVLEKAVDST